MCNERAAEPNQPSVEDRNYDLAKIRHEWEKEDARRKGWITLLVAVASAVPAIVLGIIAGFNLAETTEQNAHVRSHTLLTDKDRQEAEYKITVLRILPDVPKMVKDQDGQKVISKMAELVEGLPRDALRSFLAEASNPQIKEENQRAIENAGNQVYLHYADGNDLSQLIAIRDELKKAGFQVYGPEQDMPSGKQTTRVFLRYFDAHKQPQANSIAEALRKFGVSDIETTDESEKYPNNPKSAFGIFVPGRLRPAIPPGQ